MERKVLLHSETSQFKWRLRLETGRNPVKEGRILGKKSEHSRRNLQLFSRLWNERRLRTRSFSTSLLLTLYFSSAAAHQLFSLHHDSSLELLRWTPPRPPPPGWLHSSRTCRPAASSGAFKCLSGAHEPSRPAGRRGEEGGERS